MVQILIILKCKPIFCNNSTQSYTFKCLLTKGKICGLSNKNIKFHCSLLNMFEQREGGVRSGKYPFINVLSFRNKQIQLGLVLSCFSLFKSHSCLLPDFRGHLLQVDMTNIPTLETSYQTFLIAATSIYILNMHSEDFAL